MNKLENIGNIIFVSEHCIFCNDYGCTDFIRDNNVRLYYHSKCISCKCGSDFVYIKAYPSVIACRCLNCLQRWNININE